MSRVRISRRARSDLQQLLATSQELWGAAGAARYAATLASAITMIASAPHGPLTRDRTDLLAGLRSLHARRARGIHGVHAPVHVIYFRVTGDLVEVIRILHERMDPGLHLHGAAVRTRRARSRNT